MGIYIRDMTLEEFSTYGEDCQLLIGQGFVDEIPSHGDLIDRDVLTISTAVLLDGESYRYVHIDNIKNAPIIIPGDPKEDK